MGDTLMMPLCMHSLSVQCGTLTQQSAMAVRRSWEKLLEKVKYHEVICGSPINCGQGTTDTRLQRRPSLTPAQGWGWNILVWVVIHKHMSNRNLIHMFSDFCFFVIMVFCVLSIINHLPLCRSVPDALASIFPTWFFQQGDESWDLASVGGTLWWGCRTYRSYQKTVKNMRKVTIKHRCIQISVCLFVVKL